MLWLARGLADHRVIPVADARHQSNQEIAAEATAGRRMVGV
jgi:hypothetical protein